MTALMLQNGSVIPNSRSVGAAEIQLPGVPNTPVSVQVTSLVDTEFQPVNETHSLTTDASGYLHIPMLPETRWSRFTLRFSNRGEAAVVQCYSEIKTKDIWDETLPLRAALLRSNRFAIDASAFDHQPSPLSAREQIGPVKAARAIAIFQLSVFEAINSITQLYPSKFAVLPVAATASKEAAVAQATHDSLLSVFPSQAARLATELAANLATVPDGAAKTAGIAAGAAAAAKVIAARATDGAPPPGTPEESYAAYVARVYGANPIPLGDWTQDPVSQFPPAMGSTWGTDVQPFVIPSASTYRCPPLPALNSQTFADAFSEAKALGGDPNAAVTATTAPTSTVRSEEAEYIGKYFAYDGTNLLCGPSRLYNQIATQLGTENGLPALEFARMLAVLNATMADAGLSAWESKYYYKFWRPVTAIRNPLLVNPDIVTNPTWTPLGAPNSNSFGPNFTPPFPSYPSGHGTFGGAVFQVLRAFLGGDEIPFTFLSEEFNGITLDNHGIPRPYKPRSFYRLSQAEEENGQSRIYLGIHWNFDKTFAVAMGNAIADDVLANLYA